MKAATVPVSLEALKQWFERPLREAAAFFRISTTSFKYKCRQLGIARWPYRKLTKLKQRVRQLETIRSHEKAKQLPITQDIDSLLAQIHNLYNFDYIGSSPHCKKRTLQKLQEDEEPEQPQPVQEFQQESKRPRLVLPPISSLSSLSAMISTTPLNSLLPQPASVQTTTTPTTTTEDVAVTDTGDKPRLQRHPKMYIQYILN